MAKDQAIYFLSEESLEALEASQGAIYLIRFPSLIAENNKKLKELDAHRTTWAKMIEEEQKGVDAYHELPWIKRVSKKHKLEKDAHVANLGNFAKYLLARLLFLNICCRISNAVLGGELAMPCTCNSLSRTERLPRHTLLRAEFNKGC